MFRENVRDIVAVFDAHDPGVLHDGTHLCPCGYRGNEAGWLAHLGEELEARFAQTVELPLEVGA